MILSFAVYAGLFVAFLGAVCLVKPLRRLGVGTRRRAAVLLAAGAALIAIAFLWPASETRVATVSTRLDQFAPVYQFHEVHSIVVHASPERVDRAIREVPASEIKLFATLTWIRRLGRPGPASIMNAPEQEPILAVATRTSFLMLADEPGQEIVLGTLVTAPRPSRLADWTPEKWQALAEPGYSKAAMNFRIEETSPGECRLTTETRVYASDAATARRFAGYWRVIHPGSALIRIMWLRAIRARAEAPPQP